MWTCSKCSEPIEEQFCICWSCGATREGIDSEPTVMEDQPRSPGATALTQKADNLKCAKCGSADIIPKVRIVDRGHGNGKQDLTVEIYENPEAWIFKGAHSGILHASICGECGHVELHVSNPRELLRIYRRLKHD